MRKPGKTWKILVFIGLILSVHGESTNHKQRRSNSESTSQTDQTKSSRTPFQLLWNSADPMQQNQGNSNFGQNGLQSNQAGSISNSNPLFSALGSQNLGQNDFRQQNWPGNQNANNFNGMIARPNQGVGSNFNNPINSFSTGPSANSQQFGGFPNSLNNGQFPGTPNNQFSNNLNNGMNLGQIPNGGQLPNLNNGQFPNNLNNGQFPNNLNNGQLPNNLNNGFPNNFNNGQFNNGQFPNNGQFSNNGQFPNSFNNGQFPNNLNNGQFSSTTGNGQFPAMNNGQFQNNLDNQQRPNNGQFPNNWNNGGLPNNINGMGPNNLNIGNFPNSFNNGPFQTTGQTFPGQFGSQFGNLSTPDLFNPTNFNQIGSNFPGQSNQQGLRPPFGTASPFNNTSNIFGQGFGNRPGFQQPGSNPFNQMNQFPSQNNQFGPTNSFGQNNQFGSTSPFGQNQFGSTNPSAPNNQFGQNQFGSANPFGQNQLGSTNPSAQNNQFGQNQFGLTNPLGQNQPGSTNPSAQNNQFGQNQFGSTNPFGQNQLGSTNPSLQNNQFGQNQFGSTNPFGQNQFGQNQNQVQSPFGQYQNPFSQSQAPGQFQNPFRQNQFSVFPNGNQFGGNQQFPGGQGVNGKMGGPDQSMFPAFNQGFGQQPNPFYGQYPLPFGQFGGNPAGFPMNPNFNQYGIPAASLNRSTGQQDFFNISPFLANSQATGPFRSPLILSNDITPLNDQTKQANKSVVPDQDLKKDTRRFRAFGLLSPEENLIQSAALGQLPWTNVGGGLYGQTPDNFNQRMSQQFDPFGRPMAYTTSFPQLQVPAPSLGTTTSLPLAPPKLNDIRNLVPGTPGVDYPVYNAVPDTGFSCEGRVPGYYADTKARCQAFHICIMDPSGVAGMNSFLCANGTVFNEGLSVCQWWADVPCQEKDGGTQNRQFPGKSVENQVSSTERSSYVNRSAEDNNGSVGMKKTQGFRTLFTPAEMRRVKNQ